MESIRDHLLVSNLTAAANAHPSRAIVTIIFAQTRYHYPSYIDFWRLVVASEFQTCFVDEIDPADDTKAYIFTPMNGEGMERLASWTNRRAKIIWWNLERPEDDTLSASLSAVHDAVDAVWVSDRSYAARDPQLSYVQIAGHPQFGKRSQEKLYDVCHLAYLWGRRRAVIDVLVQRGVKIAPESWGQTQQDEIVAKSRLMLNMHQYDGMNILAPIRFAVAASYGIPIISEPYADPVARFLAIQARLGELPNRVESALEDPSFLLSQGDGLFNQLCIDTDFRREVEQGVARLWS
jgi:hypothetical protein